MRYKVIFSDSALELEDRINAALVEGWQLQGGASVSTHFEQRENSRKGCTDVETCIAIAQAMIKETAQ